MNWVQSEKKENLLRDLHPAFGMGPAEQTISHPERWQGSHTFRLRQPSRLPAFSRHYFPGDPLKLIDWKAYARTDQLLVREDKRLASGPVLVCVDICDSMLWPHPALTKFLGQHIPTKFEIALRAALHICYQRICLGDHTLLLVWHRDQNKTRPNQRISCNSTAEVLQKFEQLMKHGFTPHNLCNSAVPFTEEKRFEHGYWISDGLGPSALPWIASTARKTRNILVMSSLEFDLGWLDDAWCYFDDSAEKKEYLGAELKSGDDYGNSVASWQKRLQQQATTCGGSYQCISDKTPIIQYQQELLEG